MNKTLLLIICDFLLLNLLALTRWEDAEPIKPRKAPINAEQENVMSPKEKDRLIIMHKALEDREMQLKNLASKLLIMGADTNAMAGQVGDMQKDLQIWIGNFQASQRAGQELKNRYNMLLEDIIKQKAEKTVVKDEHEKAKQRITLLEQQLQLTQKQLVEAGNLATNALQTAGALTNRFTSVAKAANQTSQQVAGLSTNLARTGQQVAGLSTNIARTGQEVAGLSTNIARTGQQVAGLSTNIARTGQQVAGLSTNVARTSQQVAGLRTNVTSLNTNVTSLNTNVTQVAANTAATTRKVDILQDDIRKNRPFNANTLFGFYQTNHVNIIFNANRPGLVFDTNAREEIKTILVQHENVLFALVHASDTPFGLSSTAIGWTRAHGSLKHGSQQGGTLLPLKGFKFLKADPRVLAIPFADAQIAAKLNVKPFVLAKNPFHFPKAVVIGKDGDAFGEYRFDINPKTPGYVQMDKPFAGGLFSGAFNPSTGDLVVSETGELLGIMVNRKYCWVVKDLKVASNLIFGQLSKAAVATQLKAMHRTILTKPSPLR